MDIITTTEINRIKKITSLIIIICCCIGFFANIFISGTIFNITLLISIAAVFTITSLADINNKFVYMIQISIIILTGIVTMFWGGSSRYLGDLIILTGILLAYVYRLFISYSYLSIVGLIILLTVAKGIAAEGNVVEIIITIVSSTFVLLVWTLLKNLLNQYIREYQKNESLARIGMNAGNFLHNLHLATAMRIVKAAVRYNKNGDNPKTTAYLERLESWIDEKTTMRNTIVQAITTNRTTETEPINIHETICMVLETLYFDERVYTRIRIKTDFLPVDLFIKAVPFEIYYILQNTLMNAIEVMLALEDREHELTIKTAIHAKKLLIIIKDTGPGFPLKHGQIDLTSKKPTGGYGTKYIQTLMKGYLGSVEFTNNQDRGATVTLCFPREAKISIRFPDLKRK